MDAPSAVRKYSEPEYAKPDQQKTNSPYWRAKIDKYLIPETQRLLDEYSNIPLEKQSYHVHKIRDQAWAIRSYPCTGLGMWLDPFLPHSPSYQTILQRLRDGARLIEIGCFLGNDLCRLAFDGAPTDNMYGVDIVNHWDVSFAMYRDRGRFKAQFIQANLLSNLDESPALKELQGTVDIIYVSAVLHQWDWKGQVEAAKRVAAFTRAPSREGCKAMIVGYQVEMLRQRKWSMKRHRYPCGGILQRPLQSSGEQVGAETGTTWKTESRLRSYEEMGWDPADFAWLEPGDMALDFVVTRIR
ncbi:hypothetical protein AJ79_03273 [Helicocarpus griseus UAMH5409]|uniref:Methyltransferase domain-containing protein n=1 Tax=Helicocarpus griseus UAMH5409 TaxID=1447875 RepID=A0A2B7XQF8_9EURO|nr:hypothetical protein AJ79_03273 [Helicocarpus griseus UAMH5409]